MKFSQILCAIFVLIVLHLTVFVSASTIQRSLSDDIRNGISIAGKILGVDSPSNIAVVSNIAELVTRAFSQTTDANQNSNSNQPNGWDRRQMFERRPTEHLEDFDEIPQNTNQAHSNEQGNIDDNVIIGGNVNTKPTTSVNHGFMGQVLSVMGMDTSKIGALAINGIIFIAQMIGRSFMSAFTSVANRMTSKPNQNINLTERSRRLSDDTENVEVDPESKSIWEDTLGWLIDRSKTNEFLSKQFETMLDRDLPERLVNLVDSGDNDESPLNGNRDCIKQLLCKTTPFIWSMQKAISAQMNSSDTEDDAENDAPRSTTEDSNAPNDGYNVNGYFKYLPSVDEFKNHGVTCEDQYKACKMF